jgi:CO dehydrogenase/acetyl-CoA synthase alpha subunit
MILRVLQVLAQAMQKKTKGKERKGKERKGRTGVQDSYVRTPNFLSVGLGFVFIQYFK